MSALRRSWRRRPRKKATALPLVDAFVTTYSRFRSEFGDKAPVPATFRAHSIEGFNKERGSRCRLVLRWVGRQGRQITTAPFDPEMARAIEEFAATTDRTPKTTLKTIDGRYVLRTVYPSLANEKSCVTTATRNSAEIVLAASESVEGAVENLRREVEIFLGNVAA